MKRNMDLVRLLLFIGEGNNAATVLVKKYDAPERCYHIQLLIEEGFLNGLVRPSPVGGPPNGAIIHGLTWKGHDFLDAVRNDDVWARVKKRATKAGAWTAGLLLDLAKDEAKKLVGL